MLLLRLVVSVALCWSVVVASTCYGQYTMDAWNTDNQINSGCTTVMFSLPYIGGNGTWVTAAVQILGDVDSVLIIETSTSASTTSSDGLGTICVATTNGYAPTISVVASDFYEGMVINFAFYASFGEYCTSVPPYQPPVYPVIYVQANDSISALSMDSEFSVLSLSSASAIGVPAEYFSFSSGSAIVKMETMLSDDQYLATSGVCNIGQWYEVPDGSLSFMVNVTEYLSIPGKLQSSALLNLHLDGGHSLAVTGGEVLVGFNSGRAFISADDIDQVEISYPAFSDRLTAKDFTVWPQATNDIKLAYHVAVGNQADFYAYKDCDEGYYEYECGHIFDFSLSDFIDHVVFEPSAMSSVERLQRLFSGQRETTNRDALEQPAFELFL